MNLERKGWSYGSLIDEAAKRLNLLRVELAGPGRKITVHIHEGHPAEEILALAKKQDASLIMMGSLG